MLESAVRLVLGEGVQPTATQLTPQTHPTHLDKTPKTPKPHAPQIIVAKNKMELKKSHDTFSGSGSVRPNFNVYKERGIGKFKVICGGRATMSGTCSNSICTWVLILVPSLL